MRHNRILIIKLGALGDCIQAMGAIADIRAHHDQAEISVLTTRAYQKLFERCPHVDHVMIDPRKPRWRPDVLLSLFTQFQRHDFDFVYDLQNSKRTQFYCRFLTGGLPFSGRGKGARFPAPHGNREGVPPLKRLDAQLQAADIRRVQSLQPDISWMADDVSPLLRNNGIYEPFIVLLPGSSAKGLHKRWPHYHQLASLLIQQGYPVITIPGPGEIDLCRSIPSVVLVKETETVLDLFELAGVLSRARYVIGNDSGPTHIAAHLGVTGCALFGPHISAEMTSIKHADFEVIEAKDLNRISADMVFSHVCERLAGDASRQHWDTSP